MLLLPNLILLLFFIHAGETHKCIILNRAVQSCASPYFFSLSIALACRLVCVLSKTASCCAHLRHSPATRGPLSALSASATCFSFFLRHKFTSSHSFWLMDRSLLKIGDEMTWGQNKIVVNGGRSDCGFAGRQTWGRWLGHPAFQFVLDAALSGDPDNDNSVEYQRGRQNTCVFKLYYFMVKQCRYLKENKNRIIWKITQYFHNFKIKTWNCYIFLRGFWWH